MRLYDIAQEYQSVYDAISTLNTESEDYEDVLQAYMQAVVEIDDDFEKKAGSMAVVIKQLQYDAESIKKEKQRLAKRQATCEKAVQSYKDYLFQQMQAVGKFKVATPQVSLSIRNNGESVKITDLSALEAHDEYWKPRKYTEEELNKTSILAALKSGQVIEGAELQRTQSLMIR